MKSDVNVAGNLAKFDSIWRSITKDKSVLDIATQCHIEFIDQLPPVQEIVPRELSFSVKEFYAMKQQLTKLADKRVIAPVKHCKHEFISNIFCRPKPNGSVRIILNLTQLNKHVQYQHFKMESFSTALSLITKDCYFASVDLKDAYYSVPIAIEHRKYLRFTWEGKLFEFTCLPNGLACAPRLFTKLLKPVFASLRNSGLLSVAYIDDSLLLGDSFNNCLLNVEETVKLLTSLGFSINYNKSVLSPVKSIKFLGFIINSTSMTIKLTPEKIIKILSLTKQFHRKNSFTIFDVASLIGVLVASFPAVKYGPLHYRNLEIEKCSALTLNKGRYKAPLSLSHLAYREIDWWIANVENSFKDIHVQNPAFVMNTDASGLGWGAIRNDVRTGGRWSDSEICEHINVLELKAVFFGLKSLCSNEQNVHIRLRVDNMTAMTYINNMGGIKSINCNRLAFDIWSWCIDKNIWISAEFLPGSENVLADKESRIFNDSTEWMLDKDVFTSVVEILGYPDIDLFASRLNKQIDSFASWKPDPDALFIDAFNRNWNMLNFYAFPPFSVISQMLQKIVLDQTEGLVVVPLWAAQPWFPKLLKLLVQEPILLPLNVVHLPYKKTNHPLHRTLRLIACRLSGDRLKTEEFRSKLSKSSLHHGETQLNRNIALILKDGLLSVMNGKLIPIVLLKRKC